MFVALCCCVPGGCLCLHVADVEAHCVKAFSEFGAYKGAQVELEILVVEKVGGVEVAEESFEDFFEAVLVPRHGELHERVAVEIAEVKVCGCVDLGRSECPEEVVQYLIAFEIDCSVEEVPSRLVVEMRLDEVELDEKLETFETVSCTFVGHGVLSVDLVCFQIGASELNRTTDDDVISQRLQEVLDIVVFEPGVDAVRKRPARGSHHMGGMDAGAGQMRLLCSDKEQPVEHLVDNLRWNGGEADVVGPVVDRMLICAVVVQMVKVPFGLFCARNGEAECSTHEDVNQELMSRREGCSLSCRFGVIWFHGGQSDVRG